MLQTCWIHLNVFWVSTEMPRKLKAEGTEGTHSSSENHPSSVYKIFLTMFAEFPYFSLPFNYV